MTGVKPIFLSICVSSFLLSPYFMQEKPSEATADDPQARVSNAEGSNAEAKDGQSVAEAEKMENRILQLESQVNQLQLILFKTVKLDKLEAERRYKNAKEEFEGSERLQSRGILSSIQLDIARFDFDRARLELMLAQSDQAIGRIAAEIDLNDAKQRLRMAEQQLQNSEFQMMKGYMTQKQFDLYKQNVADRKRELEMQVERMNAVEKLFSK